MADVVDTPGQAVGSTTVRGPDDRAPRTTDLSADIRTNPGKYRDMLTMDERVGLQDKVFEQRNRQALVQGFSERQAREIANSHVRQFMSDRISREMPWAERRREMIMNPPERKPQFDIEFGQPKFEKVQRPDGSTYALPRFARPETYEPSEPDFMTGVMDFLGVK